MDRFEVVVVGGGTSGLQAALQLAKVGRSVVVLERRSAGKSGARWCNGVVDWQFERAGLTPSEPPERRSHGGRAHMISPSGAHRFTIDESPVTDADMRLLTDRLAAEATAAGVEIRWGATEVEVELHDGRPRSLTHAHVHGDEDGDEQGRRTVDADLFVDASGRTGVVRQQIPELTAACPAAGDEDLCAARQLVLDIDDPEGARQFLEANDAKAGDSLVQIGMAGGYSTINITVEESFEEVSVLTGSIPGLGYASGAELLAEVRADNPWMGKPRFGGGGLIPLRRVYDRFTAPGVALVGDAACQVMAGHGSGIGFGMIAGKVLAEAVDGAPDPGHPDVVWDYQARYLREFGATLASYDAVRRMSVDLGSDGVEALYAAGVFSPSMVEPGLDQRLGMLRPGEAVRAGRELVARPRLARIVVPALAAMGGARALYRAYPKRRSPRALRAWSTAARVLGGP